MLKYNTGSVAATVQSIVYGGATGGIFSLLQSAGATMVLQPIGTILAGAATTGAGVVVAHQPGASTNEPLHQAAKSIAHSDGSDDCEKGNPSTCHAIVPEEYLLTPLAILAIVKSWDVGTYNPPGTNCTSWLHKVYNFCEQHGIPAPQRAVCAMHHMRADCKEASLTARCYDMTWDWFTVWLCQYNRKLDILMLTSAPH